METSREALWECRQLERVQGRGRASIDNGISVQMFPMTFEGIQPNKMTEYNEEKTGFHTEEGVYCFTHMPKELKNSAATLQRMMEEVLANQRGRNVEIYLEEIVIKSKCELDLVQDVEETLRKLKRVNIKIDPVTSSFEEKEGRFLGERKDKFIPKMAELQYPIRKVRMKFETTEGFGWTNKAEKSLQRIKRKVNKLQTLAVLKEGREIIKEGSGVGIILVSPEETIYSYAIRLKFNTSNHAMDCKALLIGLAVSVLDHTSSKNFELQSRGVNRIGNHKIGISQSGSIDGYQNKTTDRRDEQQQEGKSSKQCAKYKAKLQLGS
ncbi:hypothetical protein Tco_1252186 [Tanacetum coccineum]